MRKLLERLIVFFVGGPLILSLIYYLPHYNFLAYHILILTAGILANSEMYNLLSQKTKCYPKNILSFLGSVLIVISYISGFKLFPQPYIIHGFWVLIVLIISSEIIFSFGGIFTESIIRIITGVFMFVYPWGLLVYFSLATALPHANKAILTFLLMSFSCDSIAWLFGMLFGGNNRGFVKASPKKSIAGFIGGYAGSITAAIGVSFLFKEFKLFLPQLIIIAVLTATAAIIGDLIESILKRAAEIKDSGQVILGRGGTLDSIDSLLFAAPVFYVSFKFFAGGF